MNCHLPNSTLCRELLCLRLSEVFLLDHLIARCIFRHFLDRSWMVTHNNSIFPPTRRVVFASNYLVNFSLSHLSNLHIKMHLLEIKYHGEFRLTEFFGDNIPPYAILSHTWG